MNEYFVELILSKWFEKNNIPYWFNREIYPNAPKFTTKGTQKKIDLIIYSQKIGYIAIEIKDATSKKNVQSAQKIKEYMKEYIEKKTIYIINNEEIKIKSFAIATQFSLDGKLFNEQEIDIATKKYLVEWKIIPPKEYIKTKDFLRTIWQSWARTRTKQDIGLGIILSTKLDNSNISKPAIFTMLYDEQKGWKQRWKQL